MTAPTRVEVPTCIGCGAMSNVGTCETGCSEQRRDLVRAAAYDALVLHAAEVRKRAKGLRAVAKQIATADPASADCETSYREAQEAARAALLRHPDGEQKGVDWNQLSEPAITWWCQACGGIDAPQPCLGICVWRPVEWVDAACCHREHERFLADRDEDRRLRALMRRVAHVTPRAGQWERSLKAFQRDAQQVLEACGRAGT